MFTRPASTTTTINAPLSHTPELISFRLFLTGINPQIARHRGCDQNWSHSRGACASRPNWSPTRTFPPNSPNPVPPRTHSP